MIDATPENVWRVFRDPKVTKKMGGHYVSDWKVGMAFGWKGNDGKTYTQGKILALEENKLLEHNLYLSAKSNTVTSVITYRINSKDGKTFLHGKEVPSEPLDDEEEVDSTATAVAEPSSPGEYFDLIDRWAVQRPPITPAQVLNAKRYLYIVFKGFSYEAFGRDFLATSTRFGSPHNPEEHDTLYRALVEEAPPAA